MKDETVQPTDEVTAYQTPEEAAAEEALRPDVQAMVVAEEYWEATMDETRGDDAVPGGDDVLVGGLASADDAEEG